MGRRPLVGVRSTDMTPSTQGWVGGGGDKDDDDDDDNDDYDDDDDDDDEDDDDDDDEDGGEGWRSNCGRLGEGKREGVGYVS